MTCEAMRGALLTAELAELRGEGNGEVATHLRTCASCRADAARVLQVTAALRTAVRRRRRRTGLVKAALPLAAAAGVVLWLHPYGRSGPTPTSPIPTASTPVLPATPDPERGGPPAPRPIGTTRDPARTAVVAAPIAPVRYEGAVPMAGVAVVATPLSAAPLQVSTPQAPRKRPRVVPTSDPAITLLWFE